jgi:N-methylhydantoinase A/oxoprolinase/acetone carboxylase beta subunit
VLTLGIRYLGQGYEIAVPVDDFGTCDSASLKQAFAASAKMKPGREVSDGAGRPQTMPVYNRYGLRPGDVIEGSALIEENDATIYLPSFARGVVTETFDIVAEIRAGR